jgi:putative protease
MKAKKPAKKLKKTIKKIAAKVSKLKKKPFANKLKKIGKITHYFDKIKVAVVKLSMPLKLGDKIRIEGGENTDFKQQVKSMQINHEKVKMAKIGKSVGLKVSNKVREGYIVYKI